MATNILREPEIRSALCITNSIYRFAITNTCFVIAVFWDLNVMSVCVHRLEIIEQNFKVGMWMYIKSCRRTFILVLSDRQVYVKVKPSGNYSSTCFNSR
jgi:hypothetical protein